MPKTRVIAATLHSVPRRIAFDIDFADGTVTNLSGENIDADWQVDLLSRQGAAWPGFVTFPWMETHAVGNPFRDPRGMAWLLISHGFAPEGELAQYPAPAPRPLPPGAIS